jgi:predicted transposase YbfD/YdcC
VVLDRLDPRAQTRALLGLRPGRRHDGPASASVRGYRARRAAQRARTLARARLRAVAVDGKTSRGARRADGTRGHLHGGRLLDHLAVDVKHNETSHFTELLEPLDLAGAVVTFDALHTMRANLSWLAGEKKAHYIAVIKQNQPLLHARVKALPWRQVPAGSSTRETGHGRTETRTLKAAHVSRLDFPHACQAIKICRWRKDTPPARSPARPPTPPLAWPALTPPLRTWPAWSASTGPSRHITTSGTRRSAKTPPPAVPAAGPPTWPPSAPRSSRPSRTPATCTSPKADATTHHRRNPPPPRPRLGRNGTFTEHAGALSATLAAFGRATVLNAAIYCASAMHHFGRSATR